MMNRIGRPHRARILAPCRRSKSSPAAASPASGPRMVNMTLRSAFMAGGSLLTIGAVVGRTYSSGYGDASVPHVLPSGAPRSCCDCEPSAADADLLSSLRGIVSDNHVLTSTSSSSSAVPYISGERLGGGPDCEFLCVVRPGTVAEAVECLQLIVQAGEDYVVIPQGANTGLTGGSVPGGTAGRKNVVLSMRRCDGIFPMDGGQRVLCFAGAGIRDVHGLVSEKFGREGHSALGSSFLNPSVAGGVAFGSGGTQLRKGPAYTDRALYCKIGAKGEVEVVDALGIELPKGKDAVTALSSKDECIRPVTDVKSKEGKAKASDVDYKYRVCDTKAKTVARCNADTSGTYPNRSEGKVLVLATVHDTFEAPRSSKMLWISFDELDEALAFRKEVCLADPNNGLPISCEYLNRDACDVVNNAGRILCSVLKWTGGGGTYLEKMWTAKKAFAALPLPYSDIAPDYAQYLFNPLFPAPLPKSIMRLTKEKDHHIMLEVGDFSRHNDRDSGNTNKMDDGTATMKRLQLFLESRPNVEYHECTGSDEVNATKYFRFSMAPAFRPWCIGRGTQGISVDYALPRNGGSVPSLVSDGGSAPVPVKRMRYSHFGCNVVHEDIAYEAGVDVHGAKMSLKHSVDGKKVRGRLPAEHGHGTEYNAPELTKKRWMEMDPMNKMNPGVGGTPSGPFYKK